MALGVTGEPFGREFRGGRVYGVWVGAVAAQFLDAAEAVWELRVLFRGSGHRVVLLLGIKITAGEKTLAGRPRKWYNVLVGCCILPGYV